MPLKSRLFTLLLLLIGSQVFAQASGDPGIGTIGNFNETYHDSASANKYQADLLFTYGQADGGINYLQPQVNIRNFNKNNSFFELRIPVNFINQSSSNISTSGMGDIIATYNNDLVVNDKKVNFSIGTRISFSNAFLNSNPAAVTSDPMAYQPGLGTIDLMAAANYNFSQYVSAAAGIQLPIINYNKNVGEGTNPDGTPNNNILLSDFHRVPDFMLKLIGHYGPSKLKLNAGFTSIIHLSNDYYVNTNAESVVGNTYIRNSYGVYLNANASINYIISKRFNFGVFFSQSIISPSVNAAGLARNWIVSPKISYAF